MARHIWSAGCNDSSAFGYSQYERFSLYENYATGRQDKGQYERVTGNSDPTDPLNQKIDKTINKYPVKLVNILANSITQQDLTVKYNSIDPYSMSVNQEVEAKLRMLVDLRGHNFFAEQLRATDPLLASIDLDSRDQLESYMLANPKDMFGMCLEQINEYVMLLSNYHTTIDPMIVMDAIVKGGMAAHDMTLHGGIPHVRRVDPKMLLCPYTEKIDASDIDAAGFLVSVNRAEFRELVGDNMTDQQIEDLFVAHSGGAGKFMPGIKQVPYTPALYGRLLLVRFFFIAPIEDIYEESRDKNGNLRVRHLYNEKYEGRGRSKAFWDAETPEGKPYRTNGKVNVYRRRREIVMEGIYLPMTEQIIQYGPSHSQPKNVGDPDKARLPLHIHLPHLIDGRPTSVVEQMIPEIDGMQRATLRARSLEAGYVPPQLVVNVDALDAVSGNLVGNVPANRETILRMAASKGITAISLKDHALGGAPLTDPTPIREVGGTQFINHMNSWFGTMAQHQARLHEIIGLDSITAGSGAPERQGKAVAQMMVQATNTATRHYFVARKSMLASVSRAIGQRALSSIREGRHHGLLEAVGERAIKFLLDNPYFDSYRYGVKIEAAPTYEEWAEIYQQAAMGYGQPGGPMFSELLDMRSINDVKQLAMHIRVQETKRARQAQAQEAAMSERQNEARMQEIQLQNQMMQQQANTTLMLESELARINAGFTAQLEELKFILKSQASTQNITQKAQSNVLLENAKAENDIRKEQAKSA